MGFDSTSYKREYAKQAYDRIAYTVPKGKRAVIKSCAEQRGVSVNQLITHALETMYKLDLSK